MKYFSSILFIMIFLSSNIQAQKEIKYSRKGNKEYKGNMYEEAELLYRRSIDQNPAYNDALFNLGDAMYKQEKYDDALKNFETLVNTEIDPGKRSLSYYNLGNTLLKSNKLKESVDAYKNSLRLNPDNHEAKYNLAYAQDLLKQQEEQEKQQQQDKDQKDQDQDQQQQDQDKKQDDNKDQKDQDQQEDKPDQSKDQNPDDQENKQPRDQMSKEDAERLLQALAADEQEVQEKVKKAKAAKTRVRTLKNW